MINYRLNDNVFREYDIRGIVEKDFPDLFVYHLGRAIGTQFLKLEEKNIAVSGDLRKTTNYIKKIFIKGLTNTGINVFDLGILPTPVNYYSMYELDDINCSVQITGSHNPKEYNGFKISYNKASFFGDNIQKLKKIINNESYKEGLGKLRKISLLSNYLTLLKKKISINKKLSIALDCLNSCGALVAPKIFKDLGMNLTIINSDIKKEFLNDGPDPTIDKNLTDLIQIIKKGNYDLGIAYDGDADRLVTIDERGKIIRPDILLALFSSYLVSNGDSVVYDVKCSKSVEDMVKSNNGIPIMYKTGHAYIKEKMKTTNAIIGGEMSGHIFFADDYFGFDDAVYASLRLAELIAHSNKKFSELVEKIPKYYSSQEIRIECNDDEEKFKISDKLIKYYNSKYNCNCIDGVKIDFGDGWGLIRASNTQPVLVCRFEADSNEKLNEIEKMIMSKISFFMSL